MSAEFQKVFSWALRPSKVRRSVYGVVIDYDGTTADFLISVGLLVPAEVPAECKKGGQ